MTTGCPCFYPVRAVRQLACTTIPSANAAIARTYTGTPLSSEYAFLTRQLWVWAGLRPESLSYPESVSTYANAPSGTLWVEAW